MTAGVMRGRGFRKRRSRPVGFVCVYRSRNAAYVADLVRQVVEAGGVVALWALDEIHPQLADHTTGSGPGSRLALLNVLLAQLPPTRLLVVADDDVSFAVGDLRRLIRLVRLGRFDLAQPAHASDSHITHDVTVGRPGLKARLTRFVEVGPLVVIGPRVRPLITPFPEEFGMGWGLDVAWSDLHRRGYRLGVIDGVMIRHHGVVAAAYSTDDSEEMLSRILQQRGHDWSYLNQTVKRWSARHPLPVWFVPGLQRIVRRRATR